MTPTLPAPADSSVEEDPVHAGFALARADLFLAIAERINLGLNPPLMVRDHHTVYRDGGYRFHAIVQVEQVEDVMAWARSFGAPVTEYGRALGDEPEVYEYPSTRTSMAQVDLSDQRYVKFQHHDEVSR